MMRAWLFGRLSRYVWGRAIRRHVVTVQICRNPEHEAPAGLVHLIGRVPDKGPHAGGRGVIAVCAICGNLTARTMGHYAGSCTLEPLARKTADSHQQRLLTDLNTVTRYILDGLPK